MSRKTIWMTLVIIGTAIGQGCGGDAGCEAPEPTMAAIQSRIFDRRCAFSGCHDRGSARGGLSLEAADAWGDLVGAASQLSALPRVAPGDPDGSFLVVKLTMAGGGSEGQRMPVGGQMLCEAEIDAIRTWIANGAAND